MTVPPYVPREGWIARCKSDAPHACAVFRTQAYAQVAAFILDASGNACGPHVANPVDYNTIRVRVPRSRGYENEDRYRFDDRPEYVQYRLQRVEVAADMPQRDFPPLTEKAPWEEMS